MSDFKELKAGKACRKKQPTDKFEVAEVDKKALETFEFIEEIELYGIQWNKFKDCRDYQWIQELK